MDEQAKKDALYEFVKKFIEDKQISCPDTIYQRDSLVIAASEFMESVVEIVGYVDFGDDE